MSLDVCDQSRLNHVCLATENNWIIKIGRQQVWISYSKTCVKRLLSKSKKMVLQDQSSLNAGQSIAE